MPPRAAPIRYKILGIIAARGDASCNDISAELGRDPVKMSSILFRLHSTGYVNRKKGHMNPYRYELSALGSNWLIENTPGDTRNEPQKPGRPTGKKNEPKAAAIDIPFKPVKTPEEPQTNKLRDIVEHLREHDTQIAALFARRELADSIAIKSLQMVRESIMDLFDLPANHGVIRLIDRHIIQWEGKRI